MAGDNGFSALLFLDAMRRARITAITRLRLDAALYDPAPPRPPGTIGRPRTKGARLPTLTAILAAEEAGRQGQHGGVSWRGRHQPIPHARFVTSTHSTRRKWPKSSLDGVRAPWSATRAISSSRNSCVLFLIAPPAPTLGFPCSIALTAIGSGSRINDAGVRLTTVTLAHDSHEPRLVDCLYSHVVVTVGDQYIT
ncbi:hypothetical protein CIW48_29510 [Methylobacterium sp. P1-11]|nr:hypothetical protein CIW48_29510 [Methylobacterium sp. P1-11]